jgi:hypothetical protein
LKLYFSERILLQNFPIIQDVQYQYKILKISEENNSFICIRLYDHNQIKINIENYTEIDNCWKIPFSEVVSSPITKKDKLYHLLSQKESQKIIDNFNQDNENIIIAYFNDLEEFNKNSRFKRYRKINNVADLVSPKKIEPNDVDINDYEYHYLNNQIIYIRNKEDNSYVEFKIIEENKKEKTKQEYKSYKMTEKDGNKDITNKIETKERMVETKTKKEIIKKKQIKPKQYIIYYTFSEEKKVIILHCHILDKTFKYKKMIIKDILDNEDPHLLKRDKK